MTLYTCTFVLVAVFGVLSVIGSLVANVTRNPAWFLLDIPFFASMALHYYLRAKRE